MLCGHIPCPDGETAHHPTCLLIPPGRLHREYQFPSRGKPAIAVLNGGGVWRLRDRGGRGFFGLGGEPLRTRLGQAPNDLLDAFANEASSLDDDTRRFWENRLRNLFEAFLLAMCERRRGAPFGDDPLTRAQHYIHAHYTRANLTVQQVADAAGCTPTHLAHVFRREVDATVRQTIIDCRLRTARRLLETGRHLVKEAAFLSGWRSPHHFSNTFATHYGVRPAELLLAGKQ